jgi:histidinol-phosphatase (PHP family)
MASVLANYHTHTPRCQHAHGSEEEFVQAAIRCGYSVLGFSDHTPWPFRSGYISNCRMVVSQLDDYVATVRALQEKYKDRLHIYLGLEAEYFPEYLPWLEEQVEKYRLDYLIFGNHFYYSEESGPYFGAAKSAEQIEAYTEYCIKGMESGLYAYLAHPDLCLNHYPSFDASAERCMRRICEAAARCHVPLEYNVLGEVRRKAELHENDLGYTRPEFWKIAAEYPVQAIVGCDAHDLAGIERAPRLIAVKAELRGMGIEVLDTLPGLT